MLGVVPSTQELCETACIKSIRALHSVTPLVQIQPLIERASEAFASFRTCKLKRRSLRRLLPTPDQPS